QVAPLDRRVAHRLLIGAKPGKTKNRLQEPDESVRVGRNRQKWTRFQNRRTSNPIVRFYRSTHSNRFAQNADCLYTVKGVDERGRRIGPNEQLTYHVDMGGEGIVD